MRTPVTRAGLPLGMVLHSPVDENRPGLLDEVVEGAGLAIEIARLRVELRRQLDEVDASRARIVSAGYQERRRLERDLHDGAQQRLITIGLALRHAQHELAVSPEEASDSIDGAVTEIDVAIEELQELATGSPAGAARCRANPSSQRACRTRPVARPGQGERRALSAGDRGGGVLHRERRADQRCQAFRGPPGHLERGAPERKAHRLNFRRRDWWRLGDRGLGAARAGGSGGSPWRRAFDREQPGLWHRRSPRSCHASSDSGGPGAPAGGPGAPLRRRRARGRRLACGRRAPAGRGRGAPSRSRGPGRAHAALIHRRGGACREADQGAAPGAGSARSLPTHRDRPCG